MSGSPGFGARLSASPIRAATGVLACNLAQLLERPVLPESYRTATLATLCWKVYRLAGKLVRCARGADCADPGGHGEMVDVAMCLPAMRLPANPKRRKAMKTEPQRPKWAEVSSGACPKPP